jgi:3',5'-cyclic AMP phosphodiesterase CpdA
MKIRVLSDLHLECDQPEVIPHANADLVVLAGDIHNHAEGLRWAAETFDGAVPVVYVPGNHEYYDGEFGALEAAMHDAAASVDNVHFLNNATLVDPDGNWRVLGTTLWTDFDLYGADEDSRATSIAAAERVMLDYRGLIQVTWTAGNDAGNQPTHNARTAYRTTRRATSRPPIRSRCTGTHARGSRRNWRNRSAARRSSSRIMRRIGAVSPSVTRTTPCRRAS